MTDTMIVGLSPESCQATWLNNNEHQYHRNHYCYLNKDHEGEHICGYCDTPGLDDFLGTEDGRNLVF